MAVDPSLRYLNDCGCCVGITVQTPVQVTNRPGLTAIAYRVGVHPQFKQTLLARLSGSGQPALRGLNTRDDDDFSIALLDAWATVADVLTFYQERIANESYLRTATERLSLLELARLVGYELQPGVAASTYLAFTLEETPGALGQVLSLDTTAQAALTPPPPITIERGTKVQSIPGPGEQAQTFETVEKIEARAEWSAIKPRLTQPQILSTTMGSIVLQGTTTNLRAGDTLLIVDEAGGSKTRVILVVTPDDKAQTTRIDFDQPALSPPQEDRPTLPKGDINDFPTKVELDESVVQELIAKTWNAEDLSALATIQNWSVGALVTHIAKQTAQRPPAGAAGVFAFSQHAALFGHNAPKWDALPTDLRFPKRLEQYNDDGTIKRKQDGTIDYLVVPAAFPAPGWEGLTVAADAQGKPEIYLDHTYPGIVAGSVIVLQAPSHDGQAPGFAQDYKVKDNVETSRSDFAISAKVSRLTLESAAFDNRLTIRGTTVLAQSAQLALADVPIVDIVQGDNVTLDGVYLGLQVGQRVILTGDATISPASSPVKR